MNFPDDPMEFIKGYSFKDEEQIYTNGAELISVLRVQQMIEHYFSDKNGWVSVKDRLPEKYIDVLVLVQYPKVNGYTGHYMVIAWKSDDDSWKSDNNNFNNDPEGVVTHWMPMPELPKEEESA